MVGRHAVLALHRMHARPREVAAPSVADAIVAFAVAQTHCLAQLVGRDRPSGARELDQPRCSAVVDPVALSRFADQKSEASDYARERAPAEH